MGMKASAKVTMRVGLVTAEEVIMYSAVESTGIHFNNLHKECHHKVNEKLFCPECAQEIIDKKTEIVKGYPNGKGDYIILTEEEIESCRKESNGILDVFQFVEPEEIPPMLYEKPYYLAAGKKSGELFGLINKGIVETSVIGLGKAILRQKDHFFVVVPYKGILVAYDMRFPDDIRSIDEIEKPMANGFDKDTVDMFKQLIRKMTKKFDESKVKDDYSGALRQIISLKAAGGVIDISQPIVEKKAMSLKDALAQSLAAAA